MDPLVDYSKDFYPQQVLVGSSKQHAMDLGLHCLNSYELFYLSLPAYPLLKWA